MKSVFTCSCTLQINVIPELPGDSHCLEILRLDHDDTVTACGGVRTDPIPFPFLGFLLLCSGYIRGINPSGDQELPAPER